MTDRKGSRNRASAQDVARRRAEEQQRKQAQQNRIIMIAGGLLAVAVIAYIVWQVATPQSSGGDTVMEGERPLAEVQPNARNAYFDAYPEMVIDTSKDYEAVIRTVRGDMRFRLYDDEAPLTVNNFVFLANQGFYDDTTFHRVLQDFMAQTGDPSGTGSGGPGYQFEDETENGLRFDRRGLLAMANSGPATNGSQFFITFVPTNWLDGRHTIFGELIEGDDVLASLSLRDPAAGGPPGDLIERIDIVEVEAEASES